MAPMLPVAAGQLYLRNKWTASGIETGDHDQEPPSGTCLVWDAGLRHWHIEGNHVTMAARFFGKEDTSKYEASTN